MNFFSIFFFLLCFILLNRLIKGFQAVVTHFWNKVDSDEGLVRCGGPACAWCSAPESLVWRSGTRRRTPHRLHLLFQRSFLCRIHLLGWFLISIWKEQIDPDSCVRGGGRQSHCVWNKLNSNRRILLSALLHADWINYDGTYSVLSNLPILQFHLLQQQLSLLLSRLITVG